ncbi:MAG: hypothetical protein F4Y22_14480 [Gammaproteobacteria bacterium]|nr:hypothetical protein [Gammaproteobacteria bacterium]
MKLAIRRSQGSSAYSTGVFGFDYRPQIGNMSFGQVQCYRFPGERDVQVVSVQSEKPALYFVLRVVGVFEHGRVIGAQRKIVLVVMSLQVREKLHRFKVVVPVIELKRQAVPARLTDRNLIGVGVETPKIRFGLLLLDLIAVL